MPFRPGAGRPPLRFLLPWLVLLAAAALVWATNGHAYTSDARLSAVASLIANRDVEVRCYTQEEPEFPGNVDAWGYVYLWHDIEYHNAMLCAAALRLHDETLSPWLRALAVLVLAHESYHLNRTVPEPWNEGRTECRAIKITGSAISVLGGDPDELYPYARRLHLRLISGFPEYAWPGCKVP